MQQIRLCNVVFLLVHGAPIDLFEGTDPMWSHNVRVIFSAIG